MKVTTKPIDSMKYDELLEEKERIKIALLDSKSRHLHRDYNKALNKINRLLADYEVLRFGHRITS